MLHCGGFLMVGRRDLHRSPRWFIFALQFSVAFRWWLLENISFLFAFVLWFWIFLIACRYSGFVMSCCHAVLSLAGGSWFCCLYVFHFLAKVACCFGFKVLRPVPSS